MEIFDAILKKNNNLVFNGGLRLEEINVNIMFIVKDDEVIYINNDSDHLFSLDASNDKKMNGRVIKIKYASLNNIIEIFVAFNENESYSLFTLQEGVDLRLDNVSRYIFQYFYLEKISHIFSYSESYSTEFERTFKLYKKEEQYFMVNNGQSQVYIIDKNNIQRSNYNENNADTLKMLFWSRG